MSKYSNWKKRYKKDNQHNNIIPRHSWILPWECEAVIDYYSKHQKDGYRRITYMMIDENIVFVSPSTVYRVLKKAGLLQKWNRNKSKKGTGFHQPTKPHEHWHIDVSYLNICGTFYYLCTILDGYSRYIVHWEIRERMNEQDIGIILQRAMEKYPNARPRIISDNGPQFIAKDFKEFIRILGMTHVRTSPYYPQSNGKLERWHRTLKGDCIRKLVPLSLTDALRIVKEFVDYYNNERLHSAIGYIKPYDKLCGKAESIIDERKEKLNNALVERKANWQKEKLKGTV